MSTREPPQAAQFSQMALPMPTSGAAGFRQDRSTQPSGHRSEDDSRAAGDKASGAHAQDEGPPDRVEDLLTVAYMSKLLRKSDLSSILNTSFKNNTAKELSGMLWFEEDTMRVLQILEGPTKPLLALLARIKQDKRHRGVHILYQHKLSARRYPTFGMLYGTEALLSYQPELQEALATARAARMDFERNRTLSAKLGRCLGVKRASEAAKKVDGEDSVERQGKQ
mmetsp:Transcript_5052/g.9785  ORF Transcript_5052/g.9785 Transcript_5052/m.9785 type:complete len:224 (+) Transcript_5052:313-984(+)